MILYYEPPNSSASEVFQKVAFSQGFKWRSNETVVLNTMRKGVLLLDTKYKVMYMGESIPLLKEVYKYKQLRFEPVTIENLRNINLVEKEVENGKVDIVPQHKVGINLRRRR